MCRQYFSRHRQYDARFCNECKCHVCSSCNCEIYHLSYQEELWAATEEKSQGGKPSKSKKKKQKKKEKEKEKKKQQAKRVITAPEQGKEDHASVSAASRSGSGSKAVSNPPSSTNRIGKNRIGGDRNTTSNEEDSINQSSSVSSETDNASLGQDETVRQTSRLHLLGTDERQEAAGRDLAAGGKTKTETKRKSISLNPSLKPELHVTTGCNANMQHFEKDGSDSIDFVLYLQQTGSIIALSKLMDALDYDKVEDEERESLPQLR